MLTMERGRVILSLAGRDKGMFLAVTGVLPDGSVLAADGKGRPLLKPKRKNQKHVQATHASLALTGMSDRALRTALRALRGKQDDATER